MMLVSFYADICMNLQILKIIGKFYKYLREILGLPVIMIVGKEEKSLEKTCKIHTVQQRKGKILSGIQGKKGNLLL